jgi:hypothetical protein
MTLLGFNIGSPPGNKEASTMNMSLGVSRSRSSSLSAFSQMTCDGKEEVLYTCLHHLILILRLSILLLRIQTK